MNERVGHYRTNLSGDMTYKSFVPNPLPPNPELKIDDEMISLLTKANGSLSTLEAVSSRIPNRLLFTAMCVRKEALLSSQIEGIQATLEDILDPMIDVNISRDVEDVINYIHATNGAIEMLQELPLRSRWTLAYHAIFCEQKSFNDACIIHLLFFQKISVRILQQVIRS